MIRICSEIDQLRSVVLHRPGRELERLSPKYLDEMLFEDVPFLEQMQHEHDQFADLLREHGVTVHYLEALLCDVFGDLSVRQAVVEQTIEHWGRRSDATRQALLERVAGQTAAETVAWMIEGVRRDDLPLPPGTARLAQLVYDDYPFLIDPVPNLYFMRDPAAVIGRGVAVASMKTRARQREAVLLDAVTRHHRLFADGTQLWRGVNDESTIEGGDVLVLSREVVAVGCGSRTAPAAIEELAERLFAGDEAIKTVLVVQLPFSRSYMHLDTVCTMVDRNTFLVYPGILPHLRIFRITRGVQRLKIEAERSLSETLRRELGLDELCVLESGGDDAITAAREQWNDGTNTLALAPGVVVTYRRNRVSNAILRDHGVTVLEIAASELVRGRGGPRCMTMPLARDAAASSD